MSDQEARDSRNRATIHTATIDVRVMKIGKRQVTQAVFRQLEEELIFNADGTLHGTPWGRVRYLWKGNHQLTDFHVVYQLGDSLKRSQVPFSAENDFMDWGAWLRPDERFASLQQTYSNAAYDLRNCNAVMADLTALIARWPTDRPGHTQSIYVGSDDKSFIYGRLHGSDRPALLQVDRPTAETYLNRVTAWRDAARTDYRESNTELLRLRSLFRANLAQMQALDQLFIAV